MRTITTRCRGCGRDAPHRPRADYPNKPRSRCVTCAAAYSRAWRHRSWDRRKAYDTWKGMVSRCHDRNGRARWANAPGVPQWRDYGGRGIKVCRRWRESFDAFLADVGLPPTPQAMDRIRCGRGYCPSNVRWADPATQRANRCNTRWVSAPCPNTGEVLRLSLSDWSRRTGVPRSTIQGRLAYGWGPARAVAPRDLVGVPF